MHIRIPRIHPPRIRLPHISLFRIFYSTTFTALFLLLLAFLFLTPADAVYQAYKASQWVNIIIIASAYILTALLAILLYASRLYTNRSVLASIPKPWIPVEDTDVAPSVRRLIVEGLARSALVAYEARPRYIDEDEDERELPHQHHSTHHHHYHHHHHELIPQSSHPNHETWAHITHPGWSSPSSPDLPNLDYESVIAELPNLIEAKAVSLAPPDPFQTPNPNAPSTSRLPTPDPRVVEVLQRPSTMGLRDYMSYLSTLSLINPPTLATDFLSLYEQARFSGQPLPEPSFRTMMQIFAEILRGMKALDPSILAELQESESSIDDNLESKDCDGDSYTSFSSEDEGEASTPGRDDPPSPLVNKDPRSRSPQPSLHSTATSTSTRSLHTAPQGKSTAASRTTSKPHSRSRSRPHAKGIFRSSSNQSHSSFLHRSNPKLPAFLHTRRDTSSQSRHALSLHLSRSNRSTSPSPGPALQSPSLQRLPSKESTASRDSGGSVIRLADRGG
jgi:hypothetical protein